MEWYWWIVIALSIIAIAIMLVGWVLFMGFRALRKEWEENNE